MASKASQIVLLCEDAAQGQFVRRFLTKGWGIRPRDLRIRPYPSGSGSGAHHVDKNIRGEVTSLRTRSASTVLLIVRDADDRNVDAVLRDLERLFPDAKRSRGEPIAFIIPKWHIETWIAFLDTGHAVDESDKRTYKDSYGYLAKTKGVNPMADKLAEACKQRSTLKNAPASLLKACDEFERIRDRL